MLRNRLTYQLSFILLYILTILFGIVSVSHAGQAIISWDPPTTNADGSTLTDLAGYKLYYGTSTGNYSTVITVGNVTTYTVLGLNDNITYYFATTAYDFSGNESTFSNKVSQTISASTDITAPIISNVTASSISDTSATISWSTDEVSSSQVEFGTGTSYGSSTTIDNTLVTSHTVTLSGLSSWTTYHFRVKSQDGSGNLTVSSDFAFTTIAPPDTTPPTGTILINGGAAYTISDSVTLTLSCSDGGTGCSEMQFSNDGTSWSTMESFATTKSWTLSGGQGSKTVYARYRDGAGNTSKNYTDTISIVVLPTITTQPANQTVVLGQSAAFNVAATGTATLSYQWQKDAVNIPGATSATYTTPATVLGDSGAIFRCKVTNAYGSTTSSAAIMTVTTGATINGGFEEGTSPWIFYTNGTGAFLTDTPGDGNLNAGHITILTPGTNVQLYQAGLELEPYTQYMLSFKAYSNTGHDLSVSLQKHETPYTSYGLSNYQFDLTAAWGSFAVEFTTSGFAGMANDGRLMFWLAPYDASGDQYFFDDVVLVKTGTAQGIPPGIISHPSSQTVTAGQTATFSVVATGTAPLSYQWQKNSVNIPGATAASYTTPATTLADSGATFRCIVSNLYGSATSTASTLMVTQGYSNNQLLLINRTFVHSTSYSAALLGETPSPTNSNCIYVLGITYSPGETGSNVCNHEAFKFFQMPPSSSTSWTSPINYAQGTLYQRVEIIEKPTTTPVRYAMCMFQDQVLAANRHACGDLSKMSFTSPGIYYSSQAMTTLYQYSTAVDWTRKPHVIMLHMTDDYNHQPDSYTGFMDKWFGTPNWSLYYPMKLRYTAIIVPPGGGAPVWP